MTTNINRCDTEFSDEILVLQIWVLISQEYLKFQTLSTTKRHTVGYTKYLKLFISAYLNINLEVKSSIVLIQYEKYIYVPV